MVVYSLICQYVHAKVKPVDFVCVFERDCASGHECVNVRVRVRVSRVRWLAPQCAATHAFHAFNESERSGVLRLNAGEHSLLLAEGGSSGMLCLIVSVSPLMTETSAGQCSLAVFQTSLRHAECLIELSALCRDNLITNSSQGRDINFHECLTESVRKRCVCARAPRVCVRVCKSHIAREVDSHF